jgi:hypothetical protein
MADDAMKQEAIAQVRNLTRLAKFILPPDRSAGANDRSPHSFSECFNDVEKTFA